MSDGELLDPPADEKTLAALDRLRAARGLRVHGLLVGRSRLDDPATDAFRNAAPASPMGVLCDDISTFLAAHDDLTLLREAAAAPPAPTTKRGGPLYAARGRASAVAPAPTKRGRGRASTRLYATLHEDDGAPATKTRFVLVQTRHPGNVGAAARALLTMGFDELVLVDPADRKILNRQKAIDGASGARGILERAKIEDNLAAALEGFDVCCATGMPTDMARARSTQVFHEPRAFLQDLNVGSIAFVFGNERLGLAEEDLATCDVVLGIPTNPDFGSLNLASAVQLVAYDWRQALGGFPARTRGGGRPSTRLYASARDDDPAAPEDPETPAPPDTILAWRESAQHRMEEPMAVPTESLTFTEVGEVTVS